MNTSLVAGSVGFPGFGVYTASKHAVLGLTRSAALDFAKQGVRINAVSPAAIETHMLDRAFGAGETTRRNSWPPCIPSAASAARRKSPAPFSTLCSPAASFIVGHDFLVDGGFTAQ